VEKIVVQYEDSENGKEEKDKKLLPVKYCFAVRVCIPVHPVK
jgi:hypothetical protein